jgi:hypothetical protein
MPALSENILGLRTGIAFEAGTRMADTGEGTSPVRTMRLRLRAEPITGTADISAFV